MRLTAALLLLLAACGERAAPDGDRAAPDLTRTETAAVVEATPVRIGEAGPAFQACQAAGTARNAAPSTTLPVRAAPFESSAISGALPAGNRFFVCTRSIDQRWMGVVYEDGGTLSPGCGVSAPAPRRAAYAGPCKSGWVASAAVRLIAS